MFKKKFFFIVFEGIEGTGKSFQIKKLYKSLRKLSLTVQKTREPGGSINSEKIRKLIFDKGSSKFDKLTDFYLMLASRNEHIKDTINKAKKNKSIIICDRFIDSTYAYQVIGHNINNKINNLNNNYILGKLKPHLTIILKSNFKSIVNRIKKRKIKNKLDNLKTNFYKKAQKAFISLSKKNNNYCLFDSSLNDNQLEQKILDLVLKKIKY